MPAWDHGLDELVEQLQEEDPSSRDWLVAARKLSHEVHHHLGKTQKLRLAR